MNNWRNRLEDQQGLASTCLAIEAQAEPPLQHAPPARGRAGGRRAVRGRVAAACGRAPRGAGHRAVHGRAIASIAFDERTPLVDGNVARVLARVFAIKDDIKSARGGKALWSAAGELMRALPEAAAPGALNQGLMELGATICSATQPRCLVCPLAKDCATARTGRQDELPVVAARKKASELPLLARTAVWIEHAGEIVLARRTPKGLFGGLWELPPLEIAEAMGVTVDRTPGAFHDQVLTHRRLRVSVVRGAMPAVLVVPADSGYDAACA